MGQPFQVATQDAVVVEHVAFGWIEMTSQEQVVVVVVVAAVDTALDFVEIQHNRFEVGVVGSFGSRYAYWRRLAQVAQRVDRAVASF